VDDFIFGTLATDELRLKHILTLRSGVTHNFARKPRDPLPGQEVVLELSVGLAHPDALPNLDRAWVYWTDDGQDPEGSAGVAGTGRATVMEPLGVEWDTLLWGYVRRFEAALPGRPAGSVVRYRIGAASPSGVEVMADEGRYHAYYVDDDPPPDWTREAVIYQVFVDRFYPGDGKQWRKPENLSGFYGGTLRGVTQKLDFIASLGANTLWLSPVFPSPTHHGYDSTDLFTIEPRLGNMEDMRQLVDQSHARGMRVLLDFVPNHWSHLHPTFQEAVKDLQSPYRPWYTFHRWPDEYETFFGVRSLPQLNLRNPGARRHMLDAAAFWLEFGVDGYRVDYAIGPTPDFWADFRRVTRSVKNDCWTFGEVVDPPDSQLNFEGTLDGCLDFVLLEALRQTIAFGRWTAERFAGFLDRHEAYFPSSYSRPSFLDNHDMNRFLWAAGGDKRRLKLAALCQFTLSGPPVIYQGTEVGLSQVRDVRQGSLGLPEEARLPMPWGDAQDQDLLVFYRSLIEFRRASSAILKGKRLLLQAGNGILVYQRHVNEETITVALNLSTKPQTVLLEDGQNKLAITTDSGNQLRSESEKPTVSLAPLSGAALV
jgi:cyclomaltodextrinase / maltogenic alpha-amylase / neopullulanase